MSLKRRLVLKSAVSRILAAKGAIVVREGARLVQRLADELTAVAARYQL